MDFYDIDLELVLQRAVRWGGDATLEALCWAVFGYHPSLPTVALARVLGKSASKLGQVRAKVTRVPQRRYPPRRKPPTQLRLVPAAE